MSSTAAGPTTPPYEIALRGITLPAVGIGTWQVEGEECRETVSHALELGYRHVDTAKGYGNEEEVGRAIAASGVARDDLWVTTKVPHSETEPGALRRAAEGSLERLGLDRVDLLLIHWPGPPEHFTSSLETMAALRDEGLIRELGVSNFPPQMLRRALDVAPVFCDQVEFHPYLAQPELLEIAAEHDMLVAAYAPIGTGRVLADPTLKEIGAAHGLTAAHVALRWLLDHPRVAVLPRSTDPDRRAANFALDFSLTDEERARIDELSERRERFFDPPWAPDWND